MAPNKFDKLVQKFKEKYSSEYVDTFNFGGCRASYATYTIKDFEHGLKIFIGVVNELGKFSDGHFKYFKEK